MLGFLRRQDGTACDLLSSKLYDEKSFYPALFKDMKNCHSELIIESPFITLRGSITCSRR